MTTGGIGKSFGSAPCRLSSSQPRASAGSEVHREFVRVDVLVVDSSEFYFDCAEAWVERYRYYYGTADISNAEKLAAEW